MVQKRRPTTTNGRPSALRAQLFRLEHKYPDVSAVALAKLIVQTPVVNDLTTGEWFAFTRRAILFEPERQKSLAKWRKMNKSILSLMNWVRGAPILGGPRPCAECGAKSQGERAVWCVSGCPPKLEALGRKARILAELEAARVFKTKAPRRFRPMVPEQDEINKAGQIIHGRQIGRLMATRCPRISSNDIARPLSNWRESWLTAEPIGVWRLSAPGNGCQRKRKVARGGL